MKLLLLGVGAASSMNAAAAAHCHQNHLAAAAAAVVDAHDDDGVKRHSDSSPNQADSVDIISLIRRWEMKIDLFSLSELFDVLDAVVSFRQQGQKIFIESLGGFDIISTLTVIFCLR